MRLLDGDSDKKLDTIYLCLTKSEAEELHAGLGSLLERFKKNSKLDHIHVNNEDYKKEVTVCIYNESELSGFHPRFKKLILEDK